MKVTLFLCALCVSCCAYAQEDTATDGVYAEEGSVNGDESEAVHHLVAPADLKSTRAYQSKDIVVHEFEEDKWKAVVAGVNYEEEEEEEKKEERESVSESPGPWSGPILKLISYIFIIGAVLTLLYFLLRNISFDLKIQRTAAEGSDLEKPVEDIATIDTQTPLEKAIREGNYKLAVRLYYLSLLKNLNQQGFIVWKKDKTNRDYLGELFSRDIIFDDIRKLTVSYESVWYGDHNVGPASFASLSARFETVLRKINNGENQ